MFIMWVHVLTGMHCSEIEGGSGPWCLSSINIVGHFCISSVSGSLAGNTSMFMWSSSIGYVPWVRPCVTWVVAVHLCHHDTGHCSSPDIGQYSYTLEGQSSSFEFQLMTWWLKLGSPWTRMMSGGSLQCFGEYEVPPTTLACKDVYLSWCAYYI